MLQRLRAVFIPEPRQEDLFECRNCGTVVAGDDTACPACGSEEIAQYVF